MNIESEKARLLALADDAAKPHWLKNQNLIDFAALVRAMDSRHAANCTIIGEIEAENGKLRARIAELELRPDQRVVTVAQLQSFLHRMDCGGCRYEIESIIGEKK